MNIIIIIIKNNKMKVNINENFKISPFELQEVSIKIVSEYFNRVVFLTKIFDDYFISSNFNETNSALLNNNNII